MTIPSLDDAVLLTGFETGIDGTPIETAPVRASSWSLASDDPWQGSQFLRWAGDARPDGGDENAPFIPQRFLLAPTLSGSDVALDLRLFARCKITPGDKPKSVGTHYGRLIVEILKGGEVIDTQIGAFLELAPAYPKSKGYWLEIGHMGIVPAGAETIRIYLEVQGGSTATIDWDEIKYLLFPYVDWGTPGVPDTGGATVDPTTGVVVQPSPAAKAAQRNMLPHSRESWTDQQGKPTRAIYTYMQGIDSLLPQVIARADAAKAVADQIPARLGSPDGTLANIPKPKATVVRAEGGITSRPIDDGYLVSLDNVEPAEGGTLQRITVDAKGRVIEAADATTDDLPEGEENLYFTPERAADAAPVQSVVGETGDVTAAQIKSTVSYTAADVGADPAGSASAAQAAAQAYADGKVADSITDGVTSTAPSQNAVFDALALKANDNAVVHTTGNETAGGNKTLTGVTRLQNGSTSGAVIFGAEVNATTITNGTRKLFRATLPAFNNATVNPMFIFGADTQNTAVGDAVYFGAWGGASGMTAACRVFFGTALTPGTTGGTNRWLIENTGDFMPVATDTYDIGAVANVVRRVYANNYNRGAVQVIGARDTGWSAQTGTAVKTGYATYAAPTISNPPTQAEVQALANAVQAVDRRMKALTDALIAHGLIGT